MEKSPPNKTRRLTRLITGGALVLATLVWLPCVHFFFLRSSHELRAPTGLSPKSRALAARQIYLWNTPDDRARETARLRTSNEEWDFMGRTFFVLSLANMSLRDPDHANDYLATIDHILTDTLFLERAHGPYVFLLPYAKARDFVMQPARSLFVDSEISLMLGARRLIRESPAFRKEMTARNEFIVGSLGANQLMAAESYPNECWTFDHAAAMAALEIQDALDRTDHAAFCRDWLSAAQRRLIHDKTGLLVSCYDLRGQPLDGPEGSTIWLVVHCLQLVDPAFAQDQYQRACHELGRSCLGFGYAQEWPESWVGHRDIDSGPIIPILNISAGASGMAFLGASSFNDSKFLAALAATLDMAAFPTREEGRLKYCASNQVGDAVVLYASVMGPLWDRVTNLKKR